MLLRKTWSGQLPLYVHPRYTPLILVTAVVLLLLGVVRLWHMSGAPEGVHKRIGIYALLVAPLALGVLIPAMPAGSSLVDPTQLNSVGRMYQANTTISTEDTTQWTLLDWTYARYNVAPQAADGKAVDVIGFVYREPGQHADEFMVVRYTLACCVADRRGVSLPVRWASASMLANDQWVPVTGTIEARANQGVADLTIVDAQVQPVQQPEAPYLYAY